MPCSRNQSNSAVESLPPENAATWIIRARGGASSRRLARPRLQVLHEVRQRGDVAHAGVNARRAEIGFFPGLYVLEGGLQLAQQGYRLFDERRPLVVRWSRVWGGLPHGRGFQDRSLSS